ncbi:Desulfoglucosinolate sulfotransferase [Bertholletia excelsa]
MAATSQSPISLDDLPTAKWSNTELRQYDHVWYHRHCLPGALLARSEFRASNNDIVLASSMKTGTTWLKALIPSIMAVSDSGAGDDSSDPLTNHHPNELMPSLERLFRTHVPYEMLPESVKTSGCKIVYVTRNPKDVVVSLWHFVNERKEALDLPLTPLEEIFENFCRGLHPYGPFHDHVLRYWKESVKRPEKILFLKYEEMKKDPAGEVRKLAKFLGRNLEREEVEKVLWRCSLERLKNLEVNKNGEEPWVKIPEKAYFRLGVVGDWKNSLSKEMEEKLDEITRNKLQSSGLHL